MRRWLAGVAGTILIAACAATSPSALPIEVLIVLDRQANELLIMPTDSVGVVHHLPLNISGFTNPTLLSVRGTTLAVGYGDAGQIVPIDLNGPTFKQSIRIGVNDTIRAMMLTGENEGYAAATNTNTVVRFHPIGPGSDAPLDPLYFKLTGPRGFAASRGVTYVINGNRQFCDPPALGCRPGKASWLSVADLAHPDSIPLIGPGNASVAADSPDGLIYVLVRGDSGVTDGQLTGINPADPTRSQFSYAGFGPAPQFLAADGFNHLLIASASGLMAFNTSNRTIIRGAPGIPLANATALTTDGLGRIYVVEGGSCTAGGSKGRIRIFGNDLVERVGVTVGFCPVAAAVTEIPAEQYRFGG